MKTAVCLYVRNEERDLPEWLAYHAALGFDTIFVYENISDDGTWEVLERAARVWDVRPQRWRAKHYFSHMLAFNHCLFAHGAGFDWMLLIDADEFFVPMGDEDVKSFLGRFEDAAAIALNFAFYGSNGHVQRPDGLIIESFTRRAPDDFASNLLVKNFVRPWRRFCKSTHYFPGFGAYLGADGAPVRWGDHPGRTAAPQLETARINHYFVRSQAHWHAKLKRGYRDYERLEEEFWTFDRNEIEDLSAARFAPRVRAELSRFEAG